MKYTKQAIEAIKKAEAFSLEFGHGYTGTEHLLLALLHIQDSYAADVLGKVGHDIGGVCPFAINEGIEVYLDESLKRFETVFPACGSSNSAIELTISELEKYSLYIAWVDVCKNWL